MLLETSGLFAYLDRGDPAHTEAVRLFRGAPRRVAHSYVLAELVALAHARRFNRAATLAFLADVQDSPLVQMEWVTEQRHRLALDLLRDRPDKAYSLCDAVSFIIMRERGIFEALTTDHHFEEEGFLRLLKP